MSVTVRPASGPPARPEVDRVPAYVPGTPASQVRRELGLAQVVKLNSNENPLGPSPAAVAALAAAARETHRYPEADTYALREALKRHTGLPADWIFAANGSDEIFSLLASVYLAPGRQVVVAAPTFSQYASSALLAGATVHETPLRDGAMDLTVMGAKAAATEASIIYLCRPNNPTGGVFPGGELAAFLRDLPAGALAVLDEAYGEYDDSGFDSVALVRQFGNLMVTRTFSKAYGLAGVRLGYALAWPGLLAPLRRVREPFSVNVLALAAGPAALADTEHLARTLAVNRSERERLSKACRSLGWSVWPSAANFILCDTGADADAIAAALRQRGVLVRPARSFGLPQALRITVGTPAENDLLLTTLAEPAVRALWQRAPN